MIKRSLEFARQLILDSLQDGDVAIDGTAGNGNDTLLLAKGVGDKGKVFAFDIQKEALENTYQRLIKHNLEHRVVLVNTGHENIKEHVTDKVSAIMFNFGYLPGGDHGIVTKLESTIPAIEQGLELLKENGVMSLMLYPGHYGGKWETDGVLTLVKNLNQKMYTVLHYNFINLQNFPPQLLVIQKKKNGI
ncbi:class I SAM-dependent methyltransferase [Alkalicella caledoniensis]|uniref:Class I SAM-dependent methyltransferase n=1 Tax=Alkalicella caledoniensis TaxID=2731377 RepID=A0A7G9WCI5_ALKCA|nr:class I SAM-dependent methyltransferase [Alkalicella caledoniensis]QNO16397.1 class I SAM-dependent methyltransferase [Alkalicella caledoniensis]